MLILNSRSNLIWFFIVILILSDDGGGGSGSGNGVKDLRSISMLVDAMIYTDQKISFSNQYYMVTSFGFVAGGNLQLNATIDLPNDFIDTSKQQQDKDSTAISPMSDGIGIVNKGGFSKFYFDFLTLWICEDNDYQSLIGSSPNNEIETKLCNSPTDGVCPVRNVSVTQNFTFSHTFEKADLYRIILLKCNGSSTVELTLDYTMMNNGHHLSLGYIQMPSVYMSMVIVIVILISIYILYLARYKRFVNEIHIIISSTTMSTTSSV
ncbi:hypothetical protein PPL_08228 [Heterostelium album PN500]|uniref:Transmembrane protein n=1 Tax=Heterostelium pallidum (strain ATCC 26659 / Pp 5 / PN500) TaxID=670386 RepID=D3BIZ3_HETP5|nr:hypothetical protein PPL_08228 [Heterostelium album PN500]EFA78767.1 hypothetical protein PPL_08228 [Heterostelium album PN500]|eukprot:XP_020430891.1 hypothetical protein PPL_08228 [Heterostelium album PN500]